MTRLEYPIAVEPLPAEEGGGFLTTAPDLPGCMSDGATPEEAVSNIQDAIAAWIEVARDLGHDVPQPSRRLALRDLIEKARRSQHHPFATFSEWSGAHDERAYGGL